MLTKKDYETIKKILQRVQGLSNLNYDRMGLMMDLEFCNDEIPLDFERLLGFEDIDFNHDIVGIYNNFNRTTKKMDNLFVPRCAA